jgi:hypothetical protein
MGDEKLKLGFIMRKKTNCRVEEKEEMRIVEGEKREIKSLIERIEMVCGMWFLEMMNKGEVDISGGKDRRTFLERESGIRSLNYFCLLVKDGLEFFFVWSGFEPRPCIYYAL